jgi:hypothetical protein
MHDLLCLLRSAPGAPGAIPRGRGLAATLRGVGKKRLDFDAFARLAQEIAKAIPPAFLAGIESVDVHKEAKRHAFLADIVTLGECETSPLSQMAGEEAFRSVVHLYYGSFVDQAEDDPSFDMEEELRETIEHEIQHHIEDRAGVKTLHEEDELFEAHARFRAGLDVPEGWYRHGEALAPGLWAVDLDLFLDLDLRAKEFETLKGTTLALTLLEQPLEVELPADATPDEVFTVEGEGLFQPDEEPEGGEEPDEDEPGSAGDLHIFPRVR